MEFSETENSMGTVCPKVAPPAFQDNLQVVDVCLG
jgi:hypothetical protein